MTHHERILIDPAVHHGRPIIRGTRVPVSVVVGSLGAGMSFEEIEREYGVSGDDIRAALRYAGERVADESVHALASGTE